MKKIASFSPRTSNQIRSSKIGVGFECIERKMWDDTPELYRFAGETGVKHARVLTRSSDLAGSERKQKRENTIFPGSTGLSAIFSNRESVHGSA